MLIPFSPLSQGFSIDYDLTNNNVDDVGYSVVQTSDGGYVMTGYTTTIGNVGGNESDMFLFKVDSVGDTLWSNIFILQGQSNNHIDESFHVLETSDGGFVLGGLFHKTLRIIKTDNLGNEVSTGYYGNGYMELTRDYGNFIDETSDGGFIVCGTKNNYNTPGPLHNDILLMKLDSNLDTLWTKDYEMSGDQGGSCVVQSSDGGFIIGGIKDGLTFIVKTDLNGDTLWTKDYPVVGYCPVRSLHELSNGDIVVGGHNNPKPIIFKTDGLGNQIWIKEYEYNSSNSNEIGNSLDVTSDGGFVMCGYTHGGNKRKLLLFRTDSNGDTLWTRVFGPNTSTSFQEGNSVKQTSDGGFIIVGETSTNILLIKTDGLGYINTPQPPTGIINEFSTQIKNKKINWNF
jgi:hypothetical protein